MKGLFVLCLCLDGTRQTCGQCVVGEVGRRGEYSKTQTHRTRQQAGQASQLLQKLNLELHSGPWALSLSRKRGGFSSRATSDIVNLDSRKKFYLHWGKKKECSLEEVTVYDFFASMSTGPRRIPGT